MAKRMSPEEFIDFYSKKCRINLEDYTDYSPLYFKDGRIIMYEMPVNKPAVPIDVTEQVAKAIAQYLTPPTP